MHVEESSARQSLRAVRQALRNENWTRAEKLARRALDDGLAARRLGQAFALAGKPELLVHAIWNRRDSLFENFGSAVSFAQMVTGTALADEYLEKLLCWASDGTKQSAIRHLDFLLTYRDLDKRALAALKAFGAPIGLIWSYSPDRRFSSVAATDRGLVALGGEFGGGGAVTTSGVRIVEQGLRNLLAHAGIVDSKQAVGDFAGPSRLMEIKGRDYYCYAPEAGLFEPAVELGDNVRAGQLCGHVHFVDNPRRAPEVCHFDGDGMVICKRHFGRVERGDCVVHLATECAG